MKWFTVRQFGRPSQLPEITKASSGGRLDVSAGQSFTVALPANVTTPYEWKVVGMDQNLLDFLGSRYTADSVPAGITGSGGTARFSFRVKASGATQLSLAYMQVGQQQPTPSDDMFTLNLLPPSFAADYSYIGPFYGEPTAILPLVSSPDKVMVYDNGVWSELQPGSVGAWYDPVLDVWDELKDVYRGGY